MVEKSTVPFSHETGLHLTKVVSETGVIHKVPVFVLFQIGIVTIYSLGLLWALVIDITGQPKLYL
jgi:hypothetical protein